FARSHAPSGRIERRRGGLKTRGRGRVEALRRRAIAEGFGRRFPRDGRERLLVARGRSAEFRIRFSSQTTDRRCSPWTSGGVSALRRLERFANPCRGGPACLPRWSCANPIGGRHAGPPLQYSASSKGQFMNDTDLLLSPVTYVVAVLVLLALLLL